LRWRFHVESSSRRHAVRLGIPDRHREWRSQHRGDYDRLTWAATAAVSDPRPWSMFITLTGVRAYHAACHLAPVSADYPTADAETPVSHRRMAVVPNQQGAISPSSATRNTCPTRALSPASTQLGVIGYRISGEALPKNAYEGTGAPWLSDNVSWTFTDAAGATRTVSFIDRCDSLATPLPGCAWYSHGVPGCLTETLDGASSPSHMVGVALNGYPPDGGGDVDGNVVDVAQLVACNGITSPTPKFPAGANHYVLPIGVTGSESSVNRYSRAVTAAQMAAARALGCAAWRIARLAATPDAGSSAAVRRPAGQPA
jgi:hypothetical protein